MLNSDEQQDEQETDPPKEYGVTFIVRAPLGLKGWAVQCSRLRNMKLTAWLIEAIREKCQREIPRDE